VWPNRYIARLGGTPTSARIDANVRRSVCGVMWPIRTAVAVDPPRRHARRRQGDHPELVRELESSELEHIRVEIGDDEWFETEGRPGLSRELFESVCPERRGVVEFLTLPAYERLED
jgi:hypothetical protein